jgi:hypothetical protein
MARLIFDPNESGDIDLPQAMQPVPESAGVSDHPGGVRLQAGMLFPSNPGFRGG